MSNNQILSFTLGDDGQVELKTAEGYAIHIVEQGDNFVRLATTPAMSLNAKQGRSGGFNKAAAVGDVMPDGSIYVGISPRNNQPCFIPDTPIPETMTTTAMVEYLESSDAHGQTDWCLPFEADLQELFKERGSVPLLTRLIKVKYYRVSREKGHNGIVHPVRTNLPMDAHKRFFIPMRYGWPKTTPAPGD